MTMPAHYVQPEARELTPAEWEQGAQDAFAIEERIKTAMNDGREALWRMMEALYEFDEESAWRFLGFESLSEWLAQPEIGMTRTTYYRYVRTWRELAVIRKVSVPALAQVDPTKVDIVMPAVKAGRYNLNQAFADVQELGWRDLREKYVPKPAVVADPAEPDDDIGQVDAQPADEAEWAAEPQDEPPEPEVINGTATEPAAHEPSTSPMTVEEALEIADNAARLTGVEGKVRMVLALRALAAAVRAA
jgi:hypothetical protein